jgi:NADPH-dependent curcumin reductase CurA
VHGKTRPSIEVHPKTKPRICPDLEYSFVGPFHSLKISAMDPLPKTQTAIVALDDGSLKVVKNVALPTLEDDMVLVRNIFVGLNPVDTKMVGHLAVPGAIAGTDYAGYVVAIGSNAQCPGLKIGDRVAGGK